MGSTEDRRQRHAVKIRKRRSNHRQEGVCAEWSCNELSGSDYRCPKHAELNAQRTRDWRGKQAANG